MQIVVDRFSIVAVLFVARINLLTDHIQAYEKFRVGLFSDSTLEVGLQTINNMLGRQSECTISANCRFRIIHSGHGVVEYLVAGVFIAGTALLQLCHSITHSKGLVRNVRVEIQLGKIHSSVYYRPQTVDGSSRVRKYATALS